MGERQLPVWRALKHRASLRVLFASGKGGEMVRNLTRWSWLGILGLSLAVVGCGGETKTEMKGSGVSKAKTSGEMKNTTSTGGGGKACVMSTINGDSNVPFYKEFANQGLTADDCPIMAFSVAEDELRAMDVPPLVGHLGLLELFPIDRHAGKQEVREGLQGLLREEQLARRRRSRHRRSDRSRLLRRLRVEGCRGEGQEF